jgi:hypothetical protein
MRPGANQDESHVVHESKDAQFSVQVVPDGLPVEASSVHSLLAGSVTRPRTSRQARKRGSKCVK